jgi:hypothetical protein
MDAAVYLPLHCSARAATGLPGKKEPVSEVNSVALKLLYKCTEPRRVRFGRRVSRQRCPIRDKSGESKLKGDLIAATLNRLK